VVTDSSALEVGGERREASHGKGNEAVPKRKKFAEVQAHINMMTMKQATAAWRCIVYVKWVRRMKFEEAIELSKSSCIKRTFARLSHSYILTSPLKRVMYLDL
jgi:hypothetical protein